MLKAQLLMSFHFFFVNAANGIHTITAGVSYETGKNLILLEDPSVTREKYVQKFTPSISRKVLPVTVTHPHPPHITTVYYHANMGNSIWPHSFWHCSITI